MLNPMLAEMAANERLARMRRDAERRAAVAHASAIAASGAMSCEQGRRRRLAAPRQTLGWLLVNIGLRLVVARPRAGAMR